MDSNNEDDITGESPDTWLVKTGQSRYLFAPTTRVRRNYKIFQKETRWVRTLGQFRNLADFFDKEKSRKMKKIIVPLIIVALVVVLLIWKPWHILRTTRATLSLSNQSYITGSPPELKEFKQNTEIYYKIVNSVPFNSSVLTIKIYQIGENKEEILHKERQEIGIDPSGRSFSFVLRPDYFKKSGVYRIKMFFGKAKEEKMAARYDFTVK